MLKKIFLPLHRNTCRVKAPERVRCGYIMFPNQVGKYIFDESFAYFSSKYSPVFGTIAKIVCHS